MDISKMDLKQKLGQLLMFGFQENDKAKVEALIKEYKFGNVILFTRNIENKPQLSDLNKFLTETITRECTVAPLISLDQECGMVQRIYNDITFFSGNMAVGATKKPENARMIGKMLGAELRGFGINMNLAPSIDVNNNPLNPVIGVRSYGDNVKVVSEMGYKMSEGLAESFVLPCIKHFPGHGDVAVDSHYSVPVVPHDMKHLKKYELAPFKYSIKKGVECVMVGHILLETLDKDNPSTYSNAVVNGLLRSQLGFNKFAITDCFEMESISKGIGVGNATVKAINSGIDMVMISHHTERQVEAFEKLYDAVKSGALSEDVVDTALMRIKAVKDKYCVAKKPAFDAKQNAMMSTKIASETVKLASGKVFEDLNSTVLIGVKNSVNTIAEDKNPLDISIADRASDGLGLHGVEFDPSKIDVSALVEVANGFDKVILALADARLYKEQIELYNALIKSGKKVLVISMRTPYDMQNVEIKPFGHIEAYEYTNLSVNAIINFIKNSINK